MFSSYNTSILQIDETITDTSIAGQNQPRSNRNEEVFYITLEP